MELGQEGFVSVDVRRQRRVRLVSPIFGHVERGVEAVDDFPISVHPERGVETTAGNGMPRSSFECTTPLFVLIPINPLAF